MKYLITGGAGFIGSHLVELLVRKKHKVVCLDDLSTGYKSNLSSVINKIEFYEDKIETFNFNKLDDIKVIIHLAAQASVPLSISKFYKSSSSNLLGMVKIIEYCKNFSIPLVYASSSAVYGHLKFGNDELNEINLLSPYATDKYVMELYSKTANEIYQLASIGLRFFNVYGPRQDPSNPYSGVISIFADRLYNKQNITINGGHQTRDFIHVKDVSNIIYRAITLVSTNKICEVSNVLTGCSITINDLAKKMMKVFNLKVAVNYEELGKGDPEQSSGSCNKMIRLFEVNPDKFIKLNHGLSSTIKKL